MWTQFSFLVTQLNHNYPKSRRGEKWKEWPKNGRVRLPGTLSTRHISPDLLYPDKRDPFLALGSAQRVADQLQPGVLEKNACAIFVPCLKVVGKNRIKMYTGCCLIKALWLLYGAPHVFD